MIDLKILIAVMAIALIITSILYYKELILNKSNLIALNKIRSLISASNDFFRVRFVDRFSFSNVRLTFDPTSNNMYLTAIAKNNDNEDLDVVISIDDPRVSIGRHFGAVSMKDLLTKIIESRDRDTLTLTIFKCSNRFQIDISRGDNVKYDIIEF